MPEFVMTCIDHVESSGESAVLHSNSSELCQYQECEPVQVTALCPSALSDLIGRWSHGDSQLVLLV